MPKKAQPEEVGIQLKEFGIALGQIAEEKGISEERVLETVESAIAAAYKKDYGKRGQHIRASFDQVSGSAEFYLIKEVVDETTREFVEETEEDGVEEGEKSEDRTARELEKHEAPEEETDEEKLPRFNPERDMTLEEAKGIKKDAKVEDIIETKLDSHDTFGRVAAQTAKQVIIQKIREAEREAMFKEYKEREGEVVNGTIQRIEGRTVFVDLGKSTGVLTMPEQVRSERYRVGQRIKVFVKNVESDPRGPGITLSRTSEELVRKLFELEVPEIFAGTVEVKAIAREAGSRTKIAVATQEESIDPIGSCVGQKGTRVQAVIDELGGEKIDIIEWNEATDAFIQAALSPAKVISVNTNEEEKSAVVTVPNDQLSLAIGRQGQNVRLSAKLTGYKIDVISDEDLANKKADKETTKESESEGDVTEDEQKEEKEEEKDKAVSEDMTEKTSIDESEKEVTEEVVEKKSAKEKKKKKKATKKKVKDAEEEK